MKTIIKKVLNLDKRVQRRAKQILKNDHFIPINETYENDVFIAGYPKSGNTWMQNLITSMLLNTTTNITPNLVSELVPDVHARNYYKRIYDRMFFKTHSLPKSKHKKVIHLVRDGRDVIVSFHHYLKLNNNKGISYEEMIRNGSGLWPCRWHEHTLAWTKNPYKANILTIRYEDLITETTNVMKKVASFLEIEISADYLNEICDHNSLQTLRKKVIESGWDYDDRFGDDSKNFFRKGIVGDYKNEINEDLLTMFNSYSEDMLIAYGYDI